MQNIRSHMTPQEEKFQNDATFQWLLSTQVEMFNRLISERRLQEDQYNQCNDPAVHGDRSNDATNQSNGFETFRTNTMATSKRMSVGVSADCFNMPNPNFDSDQFAELFYDEGKKRPKDWNEDSMNKKQKRHTTWSFFDYIFEQNGEPKTSTVSGSKKVKDRVEYMDSDDDDDYGVIVEDVSDDSESEAESFYDYVFQEDGEPKTSTVIEQSKKVKNRVEYMDSDDDDYGVIVEDVSDDPESESQVDDDDDDDDEAKMAPEEAKKHLVLFDGTMEQSQDSQQKIHDWDRKMGLKRSHSKTMRLSSRSRKQLRQFTQKDIMHIIHLSNFN